MIETEILRENHARQDDDASPLAQFLAQSEALFLLFLAGGEGGQDFAEALHPRRSGRHPGGRAHKADSGVGSPAALAARWPT